MPEDEYDLADEQPKRRRPRTAAAGEGDPPPQPPPAQRPPAQPAQPPRAQPAPGRPAGAAPIPAGGRSPRSLSYARPGTLNTAAGTAVDPEARGAAADPALIQAEQRRHYTVPLILVIVGTIVFGVSAILIAEGDLAAAAAWIAISITWDLVILIVGLLIGSRLVDFDAPAFRTLMLQTAAIVLATAAIFWPIIWLDRGAFCGSLTAWLLSTAAFCFLLSYLFDLEIFEVIVLTVTIQLVRLVANLIYLTQVGTFGYLP